MSVRLIYFISVLWLLEAFGFFLAQIFEVSQAYKTGEHLIPVILAILFSLPLLLVLAWFGYRLSFTFRQQKMAFVSIEVTLILLIIFNILTLYFIPSGARYIDGTFTKWTLLLYFFKNGFFVWATIASLSGKNEVGLFLKYCSILSCLLIVDGLASALSIFAFTYLLLKDTRFFKYWFVFFGASLLYLGLASKGDISHLITGLNAWVVSRFSIPVETLGLYLNGEHYFKSIFDFTDFLTESFACRTSSFFNNGGRACQEISSIGSANYYSLYGEIKGGSGTGIILSLYLGLMLSFIPLIVFFCGISIIFRSAGKADYLSLFIFAWILKGVYFNILDIYTIFNQSFFLFFFFLLGVAVVKK